MSEVLDCPEQDWSLVTTVGVGTRSRTLSSNSGNLVLFVCLPIGAAFGSASRVICLVMADLYVYTQTFTLRALSHV